MRFAAVISDNSGFFIEAYFAAIKSGHVCVPLNPAASVQEIAYVAGVCKPEIAFVQKRRAKKFESVFSGARAIITEDSLDGGQPAGATPGASQPSGAEPRTGQPAGATPEAGQPSGAAPGAGQPAGAMPESCRPSGAAPEAESPPGARDDDIAVVLFTSGSTGNPKGVMLSHGNLRCNTESIVEYLGIGPSERALVVLPFFYCFGTSVLHTHLRAGASVALNNEFMFPETVGEYINRYGCTSLSGVPGTYQILLRKSGFASGAYPTLRYVAQAGGKLSPVFIKELIAALPGVRIVIMYGQTEATSRLSYLPPDLLEQKMGSIGKGIPGTELRVIDERGDGVKPGEIGQIVARGGNVMKGYLGDPGATSAVLRDGALYTGDLATVDGDGFIYVAGREKQIIKYAGYRISPKEIEDVILGMGEVLEAVVFGVEDELLGEAPKAVVALRDAGAAAGGAAGAIGAGASGAGTSGMGASCAAAERIMARCHERLPSYKVPVEIEIAEGGLPKNAAGKLLLGEIAAKYGRRACGGTGKAGANYASR
ncbi:MAG: AMP-binding protein [Clostridiales bacterium]|nr:AMP-binding protein [Clostridiales bacterium]